MLDAKQPHIVVLGGGFAGLTFCREFKGDARITLVDRQNHHLFQPLLYQVATAGLSAPEIAQPIRSILRDHANIEVRLAAVTDLDVTARRVTLDHGVLDYDYLVIALGGQTSYFNHPEWEQFAPGLKSLADATRIRRDVLLTFERAETVTDPVEQQRLMTLVVVGGGPTGVELAGALAELTRTVLNHDFRHIDPSRARVILIESSPVVMSHLPPELARSAQEQLEALGVTVRPRCKVANITADRVVLDNGEVIETSNVIWAAGVAASSLTRRLGVELDRAGRVKVAPDLSVPGHPEIFAIGDLAAVSQADGRPVPGVAPAAMQMARHVVEVLTAELARPGAPRETFRYWDKGSMATIGRSAAVAQMGRWSFTGFPAWVAWLVIHLLFLVGFRNKIAVLLQWVYSYFAYRRGARIITGNPAAMPAPAPAAASGGPQSTRTSSQ